jgi:hypothetical protein
MCKDTLEEEGGGTSRAYNALSAVGVKFVESSLLSRKETTKLLNLAWKTYVYEVNGEEVFKFLEDKGEERHTATAVKQKKK